MIRARLQRLALAVLVAGAVAGPASAQKAETVSIGWTPSLVYTPFYVAMERGYFAQEGLTLETKSFKGANDAVSALATGQLDVNFGAITAGFFNAVNQGLDIRAVASMGIQPDKITTFPLLARKDLWDGGAIRTGADLKDRRVAINTPGGSVEYKLSLILDKYGMGLKDVRATTIGFPEMLIALDTKGVDAAIPTEPFATEAVRRGLAVIVPGDSDAAGGDLTTMVLFSGKFLRERAPVGERFLRALMRAARDVQGDKLKSPDVVAIVAKYTKLPPENVSQSVFPIYDPDLAVDKYVESLRRQEREHMKNGRIQYKEPLAAERMVDGQMVRRAALGLKP